MIADKPPVSRIPVELIREIFELCIPRSPTLDLSQAPLILCQINSGWRTIALRTPSLWRCLSIYVTSDILLPSQFSTSFKNQIKTWLARAGNSIPLSININFSEMFHDVNTVFPKVVLFFKEFIAPYAMRLKRLWIIGLPYIPLLSTVFEDENHDDHTSSSFLSLEDLRLIETDVHPHSIPENYITLFRNAPRLSRVVFSNNARFVLSPRSFPLPYHQITQLILISETLQPIDLAEILRSCKQLQWGAFRIAMNSINDIASLIKYQSRYPSTILPNLMHLHIASNWFFSPGFFYKMEFPSLHTLSLDSAWMELSPSAIYTPDGGICDLSRVVHGICKLSLDFPADQLHYPDLFRYFNDMPDLEEIYLQLHGMNHVELFHALQPTETGDVLPKLKVLSIYYNDRDRREHGLSTFPHEEFSQLVTSRWRTRGCLEEVILHIWDVTAVPSDLKVLDPFKQEGLRTSVTMLKEKVEWKKWMQSEAQLTDWGNDIELVD